MSEIHPAQAWLHEATKLYGMRETKGPQHTAEIVQMWRDIKRGGIKDDETPWCAAFVGACLERGGVKSSRFESAASYLDWGQKLSHPVLGCVAVIRRPGGAHVFFVVARDVTGNIIGLGGNQADQVSYATFDRGAILGYRWPSEVDVPEAAPLPPMSVAVLRAGRLA